MPRSSDRSSRQKLGKNSFLKKMDSNKDNENYKNDAKFEEVATARNSKRKSDKETDDPAKESDKETEDPTEGVRIYCYQIPAEMVKILDKLHKVIGEVPRDHSFESLLKLRDATVNLDSLVRLYPGRFLNDDLINFYCVFLSKVKYVDHEDDFIIFSTFFYESLLKMCAPDAEFNIKRVQRPKGVNIFQKKFVLIPLHFDRIHWILLVICLPNLIPKSFDDHVIDRAPNEAACSTSKITTYVGRYPLRDKRGRKNRPSMLIFDPLRGKTPEVFKIARCYLTEEYKRLYGIDVDFGKLPGYYVEGAHQNNLSDCGIVTLQNIELFLENMLLYPCYPPNLTYIHYADSPLINRVELLRLIVNSIIQSRRKR